jgi:hypothetical protein
LQRKSQSESTKPSGNPTGRSAAKKEEQEGKEQCEKGQNREKDRLKKVRVDRKDQMGERPGRKQD